MSFVPVVGQVNMDQISVDLTGLGEDAVAVGTPVELIGPDREAPNHLTTLAKAAGTIPHQILCGLNTRILRVYHAKRQGQPDQGMPDLRFAESQASSVREHSTHS